MAYPNDVTDALEERHTLDHRLALFVVRCLPPFSQVGVISGLDAVRAGHAIPPNHRLVCAQVKGIVEPVIHVSFAISDELFAVASLYIGPYIAHIIETQAKLFEARFPPPRPGG